MDAARDGLDASIHPVRAAGFGVRCRSDSGGTALDSPPPPIVSIRMIHTFGKKMTSYHVYFTAKDGVTDQELLAQVHRFMKGQIKCNHAVSYRLLRMTNKASFVDLPDFHLIVDYRSEADLQLGFRNMQGSYRDEPHAPLMKMVSTFRVAFSRDETQPAEQDGEANPAKPGGLP